MSILCSMVGASFTVAAVAQVLRARRDFYRSGNTVISTAQSKFGGSSIYFDGTDDWLETKYGIELTGDFTLEGWVYLPNVSGIKSFMTIGTENTGRVDFMIENAALKYDIYAATFATSSGSISTNTWTHIAYVRSGSTLTFYIGGTSQGTGTASGTIGRTDQIRIGQHTGTSEDFSGYIDELRLSNSARYTANFTPSTSPFVNDANTLLLMHGNGTNNSTFFEDDNGIRLQRDVVALGATAVSTTQSKFGGTSMSFGGASGANGKFAIVNQSFSDFYFGGGNTGDRTYECWVYLTAYTPSGTNNTGEGAFPILTLSRGNDGYCKWCFGINESGYLGVDYSASDGVWGGTSYANTSTTLALNTWHHIAMVWQDSGNVIGLYANGTRLVTQSGATEPAWGGSNQPSALFIGGFYWTPTGFIDEVRISNTARYTSNFTAPSAPFVNDSNTLLLVHADGTNSSTVFRDDNGAVGYTPKTLTAAGNAQTSTAQTKFGVTSGLFDGTGDYVNVGQPEYLNFGTGNWTIEGWYRASSTSGDHYMINFKAPTSGISGLFDISGGFGHWGINIYQGNWRAGAFNNKLVGGVGSGVNAGIDTTTWHHFALVRDSSTTLKYYIDGTQIGSTVTLSSSDNFNSTACYIGNYVYQSGGATGWNGYIDDLRISNTARYTGNFTAPTAAFTPDANTMLLCDFNGANTGTTFTDKCGRVQKGIQALGNAQIDTAQSKFGGSSALFDGTGDYLDVSPTTDLGFASSDWTIEFWFRPASVSIFQIIYDGRPVSTVGAYPCIYANGTTIYYNTANGTAISGGTLVLNTWTHITVSRSGTSTKMFQDGTQIGSTYTDSQSYLTASSVRLAAGQYTTSDYVNGHLDEIRISNSARYTANFTAPTAAFQNDANTLLLIHADGTDASTVFIDDNGIAPYTP